jgi:hypothetical protein
MKSSTHPSSRSFTKEKEEIVQSDLQSLSSVITWMTFCETAQNSKNPKSGACEKLTL